MAKPSLRETSIGVNAADKEIISEMRSHPPRETITIKH
jgi:hypothetical protein